MNVLTHCIHFIITLYIYSFIICRNIYWKIKKKNRKENASRRVEARYRRGRWSRSNATIIVGIYFPHGAESYLDDVYQEITRRIPGTDL